MKLILYTMILTVFTLSKSFAQDTLSNENVKLDSLRIQAYRFVHAFITLDTLEYIKYSNPVIIDRYSHGAQNVGKGFKSGKLYADSIGFKWISYELGDVSEIAVTKSECYAFIQTKSISNIRESTQVKEGYLLGISTDGGLNWRFINEEFISSDGIKTLFPNYDGKIPIPLLKKPIYTEKGN